MNGIMEKTRTDVEKLYNWVFQMTPEVFVAVLRVILTRFRLRLNALSQIPMFALMIFFEVMNDVRGLGGVFRCSGFSLFLFYRRRVCIFLILGDLGVRTLSKKHWGNYFT